MENSTTKVSRYDIYVSPGSSSSSCNVSIKNSAGATVFGGQVTLPPPKQADLEPSQTFKMTITGATVKGVSMTGGEATYNGTEWVLQTESGSGGSIGISL